MGPNRRLLEVIVSRYAPHFECDTDVLFLCVNRPGKCGTSSPPRNRNHDNNAASSSSSSCNDERRHIRTSCDDVVAILDRHDVRRANLLYMCAGSTFAYSFASRYPNRTTGHIVGIASWVLRSDPSSEVVSNCNDATTTATATATTSEEDDGKEVVRGSTSKNFAVVVDNATIATPQYMHSLAHRMAMSGYLGPKRLLSSLVGGIAGSAASIFGYAPPSFVANAIRSEMSNDERIAFDERFPNEDGASEFAMLMKWIHDDGGYDDEVGARDANGDERRRCGSGGGDDADDADAAERDGVHDAGDGNARDCAVCLSAQQELGLVYRTDVPIQRRILLWHGEHDRMISVSGADYLASMMPNVTLTRVRGGTHQGVMFFFPEDVMEALNRISRETAVWNMEVSC